MSLMGTKTTEIKASTGEKVLKTMDKETIPGKLHPGKFNVCFNKFSFTTRLNSENCIEFLHKPEGRNYCLNQKSDILVQWKG